MKNLGFGAVTLNSCVAAATLTGCGGSQPPISAPRAMPQTAAIATHGDRGKSWMLPEAKTDDLLYVGGNNDELTVYSYPRGKLVGVVKNPDFYLLSGECVDASGDIFVTSLGNEKIFEYEHGGKKAIATLQAATNDPAGCAVDPTTGNLAVTTLAFGSSGNVAVCPNAQGTPSTYTDPNIYYYYFCAYDTRGNLFVDGQSYGSSFEIAELPKGSSTFTSITVNQSLNWPGGLQWDGKYLVVGDQDAADVYEFAISGSSGTLEGTTPINGADDVHQFWIHGHAIVGGDHSDSEVQFWPYPLGGNSTKTITKDVGGPDGLSISPAKK
jgi:hypothetical protein